MGKVNGGVRPSRAQGIQKGKNECRGDGEVGLSAPGVVRASGMPNVRILITSPCLVPSCNFGDQT